MSTIPHFSVIFWKIVLKKTIVLKF
jgi:hypothetical protein